MDEERKQPKLSISRPVLSCPAQKANVHPCPHPHFQLLLPISCPQPQINTNRNVSCQNEIRFELGFLHTQHSRVFPQLTWTKCSAGPDCHTPFPNNNKDKKKKKKQKRTKKVVQQKNASFHKGFLPFCHFLRSAAEKCSKNKFVTPNA